MGKSATRRCNTLPGRAICHVHLIFAQSQAQSLSQPQQSLCRACASAGQVKQFSFVCPACLLQLALISVCRGMRNASAAHTIAIKAAAAAATAFPATVAAAANAAAVPAAVGCGTPIGQRLTQLLSVNKTISNVHTHRETRTGSNTQSNTHRHTQRSTHTLSKTPHAVDPPHLGVLLSDLTLLFHPLIPLLCPYSTPSHRLLLPPLHLTPGYLTAFQ